MTALIFTLMLSVVGALIQSACVQAAKSRERVDVQMALESTFAEYHSKLLETYEIFARHGSEEVIVRRLSYYGAGGMGHSLIKAEYLTDNGGMPFYRQAVKYMKDWYGADGINPDEVTLFEEGTEEEEEQEVLAQLESLLEQEEAELSSEGNPIESVKKLKESHLLNLLLEHPEELSDRSVEPESLPSHRQLQEGNTTVEEKDGVAERLLFTAYLAEHFGSKAKQDDSHALLYEQEYLLGGYATDRENLEAVCRKIIALRMVVNCAYLMSSSQRQAEAEAMAAGMCTLLTVPQITDLVKLGILFAWGYGESIVDMRLLLKEKKVPLIKNDENWQLQLANLVKLGTEEEQVEEKEAESGISYRVYLSGLLLLESRESLCMRSLDLIERNLNLKTDECYTTVKIQTKATDTFQTTFGYQ